MDNNTTILIILTVVGSVFGFYTKIKKDIIHEQDSKQEPIRELNVSVVKLTTEIGFLNKTIETLKERVTNHGKEIECNQKSIIELMNISQMIEKQVDRHELRISNIEEKNKG